MIALCDGEEKENLIKNNISTYLEALCIRLRSLAMSSGYTSEQRLEILNKIIGVYDVLLESESDRATELMCDVHRYISVIYADMGDAQGVIRHIEAQAQIFERIYNETSIEPSLIRIRSEQGETYQKSVARDLSYLADELLYKLDGERYDFVRDDPEFVAILDRLEFFVN